MSSYPVHVVANYADDGHGYLRVKLSDGRVLVTHRFMMERFIGRPLRSDELVHHKDSNKRNNARHNLELTTRMKHPGLHSKGETTIPLVCAACGNGFHRSVRQLNFKVNSGQKRFFCSRSCSASISHNNRVPYSFTHGTQGAYRKGCRCAKCRASNTERHRKYRERNL